MARKTLRSNFRVEVAVDLLSWGEPISEKEAVIRTRDLALAINKTDTGLMRNTMTHNGAIALWDTTYICEHCGFQWVGNDLKVNEDPCCNKNEHEREKRDGKQLH